MYAYDLTAIIVDKIKLFVLLYVTSLLVELNWTFVAGATIIFAAWSCQSLSVLCIALLLTHVSSKTYTNGEYHLLWCGRYILIAMCSLFGTIFCLFAIEDSSFQNLSLKVDKVTSVWLAQLDLICNKMGVDHYSRQSYTPSYGIRWYLDAQMLPEYSAYFEVLFVIQPFISAVFIKQHVVKDHPTIAVSI